VSVPLGSKLSGQGKPASKPIEFDGFGTVRSLCNISLNCGEFAIVKSEPLSDLFGGKNSSDTFLHYAFREAEQ